MVQIIPRNRPTFGERLGAGIEKGIGHGADFAQMAAKIGMEQKAKQQQLLDKLAGYNQFKESDAYKNLTPTQKLVLDLEAREAITGGTGKSIINFEREKEGNKLISDYLGGNQLNVSQEETPEPDVALDGMPSESNKPKKPEKNYEAHLNQLKPLLASPDARTRDFAKNEIDRINKEQERKFREKEFETKPIQKATEDFFTNLQSKANKIEEQQTSLDAQIDAVNSGAVDPWSAPHLIAIGKAFGAPEEVLRSFQTQKGKQFETARKTYLGSILKDNFRGATTGKEIDLADSLLAQAGVTKAGNLAALFLSQSTLMLNREELNITKKLREEGWSNYDIPEEVSRQMQSVRKKISKQYFEALKAIEKK